jgi:hypothetical protein
VVRGPWQDAAAARSAALVFIAPTAGAFQVAGTVRLDRWTGDQAVALTIVRRNPANESVAPVKVVALEPSKELPLAIEVKLAAGEELAFVGEVSGYHTAATIYLAKLVIHTP